MVDIIMTVSKLGVCKTQLQLNCCHFHILKGTFSLTSTRLDVQYYIVIISCFYFLLTITFTKIPLCAVNLKTVGVAPCVYAGPRICVYIISCYNLFVAPRSLHYNCISSYLRCCVRCCLNN